MNNKAQTVGLALLIAWFVFIIVLFVTIEPLKETLDTARSGSNLNCKGTTTFNQTAYDNDEDSTIAKLTKRPVCVVTGISMLWFVGAFLVASTGWLAKNWAKKRRTPR